jgi:hypothetical protein
MVLSDRFAGKAPTTLFKRTLLYVLAFGLGSLLIVTVLGFAMVSIAEGVLPAPKETAPKKPGADGKDATGAPGASGAPKMLRPGSPKLRGAAPEGDEGAETPPDTERDPDQQL